MKLINALYWSFATSMITCGLGWSRDLSKGKSTSVVKAVRTPTIGIFLGNILYPYFSNPIHLALASAIGERWVMLGFKTVYAFYYPKYKWA